MSTTLPRMMNSLNSFTILAPSFLSIHCLWFWMLSLTSLANPEYARLALQSTTTINCDIITQAYDTDLQVNSVSIISRQSAASNWIQRG